MSKYIFSLFFLCCPYWLFAQAKASDSVVQKDMPTAHQLRLSFDIGKLLLNNLTDHRSSYEFALDYYLKDELYAVLELGSGNSNINYADLSYTSDNVFGRLGIDKAMFVRKKAHDWGMGFIGCRYGLGIVQRNTAQYTTNDGFGGITSGTIPEERFTAHWLELTGGMKVELWKAFFAGWTIRAKFLLNQSSFGALRPAYIAGYGAGEKTSAFEYNFFLSYAIRWSKRQ